MPIITTIQIEEVVTRALVAHGALPWIAAEVAHAVAVAESFRNRICGLYYVESYCKQLTSGRVLGNVNPVVMRVRPGAVQVDALFGFAQPAFSRGLGTAVAAAQEVGIAVLTISHAHTCTALGYFTEQIARKGLIGIGFTNATPIVAAPGGATRLIGTNPIAFSVPGEDAPSLHFDFSTSAVALGKITMAQAAGERIPAGWAVDRNGEPTTDPAEALTGAIVSAGGHKGWGIGLMVEVMAAALTGSALSSEVRPLKSTTGVPHNLGQTYILIDPALRSSFAERMERLLLTVESDPNARVPGQNRHCEPRINVAGPMWDLIVGLAENGPE